MFMEPELVAEAITGVAETIMGLPAAAGAGAAGAGMTPPATIGIKLPEPPKLQHLWFGSRIRIQTLLERRHLLSVDVDQHARQ